MNGILIVLFVFDDEPCQSTVDYHLLQYTIGMLIQSITEQISYH